MTCAEELMAGDPSDMEAYSGMVMDNAMKIIEACSFQDLTGQRIAKVVETLKAIENRVSRFVDTVKLWRVRKSASFE